MVDMLDFIAERLEQFNIPYEFNEWMSEISYPYFVGSFSETEHRAEDGYTGGVLTIDGWSKDSIAPLLKANDKIQKEFEDLILPTGKQGVEVGTNGKNDSSCGKKMWADLIAI